MSGDWTPLLAAGAQAAARLRAAWAAPEAAQRALLARILRDNAATSYGRAHGFAAIDGPQTFRRLPIHDHDGLASWIARGAAGEADVLTRGRPICFEETSGSAGARKLIPYTCALLEHVRAAALPWLDAALGPIPAARRGALYLALSPAARAARATPGGAPIGLPDAAYLGPTLGAALTPLLAVPPETGALDAAAWRRATLAALIERADLAVVSVWSPTFFAALLDAIPELAQTLAPSLSGEARARLGAALAGGEIDARRLWPRLSLVSCWRDGPSGAFARALAARLPGVALHGKGLFATEAAVTTPLRLGAGVEACAPALLSAYLEFIDANDAPRGAHALREGGVYRVVVTTSGGLYRYDLGDRVVCAGFAVADGLRAPDLAFLGRDGVSDLVGEKLSESFAAQALASVPAPAALRPRRHPPGYDLLIEAAAAPAALAAWRDAVETALSGNPHYAHALRMRQLAPLAVEAVERLDRLFGDADARLAMVKPRAILRNQEAK